MDDDLDWKNGQFILGGDYGGHSPDLSNAMAGPGSGWVMDTSKVNDGVMTFTSKTTKCLVRTFRAHIPDAEQVPGDDRESTVKVLSAIFNAPLTTVRKNAHDITLGYGQDARHTVSVLASTSYTDEGYYFTAARAFSKPGVKLVIDSLCPTPETRLETIADVKKMITINAS